MTVENRLLALLRTGICGTPLAGVSDEPLSTEGLIALYRLSKYHDLAHIVGTVLDENRLLPAEGEVTSAFQKQMMTAVYRSGQMQGALTDICSVLEQAKIPFVPLKGAVIRDYYPAPWMRTSCDVDVLVHEENLEDAIAALERIGYRVKGPRNYHDLSLFSATGVHLELHFHIRENMESIDRLLGRVWEYAAPIAPDAYQHRLTNEYFMFHMLAHMAYHFMSGGCGIRPVIDLWIWKNKVGYDADVLKEMCRKCELELFFEEAMRLCAVWFDREEGDLLTEQMQAFILRGGVYGSTDNKVTVQHNKSGGRARYILSRIFAPYEMLKYYYPSLQKHKWLLPICQVRRWLRLIWKRSFKRSAIEVSVGQTVSRDRAEATALLLERLGL